MSQTATDPEALKSELKKLNARATQAKMDLHDLSEDLPTNWERILEVAQIAYDAHAALMQARKRLNEMA
ncbi:MAG: CCE_0567 family metalloprotein [Thiomonas sp.]|uniref:CCE_0567 family metalloprotein n=1 Tax=Thiomonas sp. TaxID=2047785 RepID=UPI002A36BCAE|nr:CCE_0567 family metalloprotein [Thiomonas sp.]MDY0329764.1 CCE_0567 family metalloprotein [Thiomonas sp.]